MQQNAYIVNNSKNLITLKILGNIVLAENISNYVPIVVKGLGVIFLPMTGYGLGQNKNTTNGLLFTGNRWRIIVMSMR